jgi:hypothetical protein
MQVANVKSYLANTNAYIKTKATWTALTGTNTALRSLISDRLQVANAAALYATKAYAASNSYLNSNFLNKTYNAGSSQTIASNVRFSANVFIQGKLEVTGGITSYFANNVSTGDNMIYLNANSIVSNPDIGLAANYNDGTYHHTGFFRDASDAGTWKVFENYAPEPDANVYINTSHASFRLAPFAAQNIRAARNLTVVANSTLGNTSVTGFLKLNGTDIRATFAQNTSVRLAIADRLQIANATATYQTKTTELAHLANTNNYIATKVNTSTFNAALANTNAYINSVVVSGGATWSALQSTNTALRALISDRMQVANVKAYLANTNSYIKQQISVANTKVYLANTNAYIATKANWSALTSTNTALRGLISDRLQVANAVATYATKLNPTTSGLIQHTGRMTISTNLDVSGNTQINKLLANGSLGTAGYALKTNGTSVYWGLVSSSGATWSALLSTNTALRALISDRMQVANVKSYLANTNSYIATKVNTSTFNAALANTNAYINSVIVSGGATWSALQSTNTALRTLISDRLQVANAAAIYQTKATELAHLANTNAFIKAQLANTNQFITTVSNRERSALANTNNYIATKLNTTVFNSALANTNQFIKNQLANTNAYIASKPSWSAITSTNTALRVLISDRLQVANAIATYQTKTTELAHLANTNAFIKAQLANTNAYIATKTSWSALTSTNTALRTLISDRLQVANAAATYQTKAVERAALANTNLYIAQKLSVANASTNYLSKTLGSTSSQTVGSNVRFSANVAIQGKLVVTGGITTYSANNISVGDNMIYLNANSTVSNPDLGFAGNYNDGTYHHAGFFRDASDNGTWKVFENYSPEPDASPYIDTTHATFRLASFSARNLRAANNLTVVGNTSIFALKANNSFGSAGQVLKTNGTSVYWDVDNSGGSGGAGLISYTSKTLDSIKGTDTVLTNVTAVNAAAYLQVANAVARYATKSNPTTSGLLAHTGRATVSTNLAVTGNTTVSTHIITPNRHAFRVYGSGTTNNLSTTQNGDGKLNNNNFAVDFNQGNCLHANTGVFTARVAGLYQICQNVRNSGYAGGISQLICYKNKGITGEAVMIMTEFAASSTMNHAGGSTVAYLAVNDTLSIRVGAGQVNFDGNDNWSVTHLG